MRTFAELHEDLFVFLVRGDFARGQRRMADEAYIGSFARGQRRIIDHVVSKGVFGDH